MSLDGRSAVPYLTSAGSASDTGVMTVNLAEAPFSLDPLIAQAKRRRQRRLIAVGLALVLVVSATLFGVELRSRGTGSVGSASRTDLTLSAVNDGFVRTRTVRAVFHLRCHPPGGDLPHPASACAAIAAQPSLITRPKPFMCWGGGWTFSIVGRLNGRPVHTKVASCTTEQMALVKFDPHFAGG
jgi:hypothetical protein